MSEGQHHVILLECYNDGSHAQLMRLLCSLNISRLHFFGLKGRKWKWRLRCGTASLCGDVENVAKPILQSEKDTLTLFTTSMSAVGDLLLMCSSLAQLRSGGRARLVYYVHENQLAYAQREQPQWDCVWPQIMSAYVCDHVIFNSAYNMSSMLKGIRVFLKRIPHHSPSPQHLIDVITPKCRVVPFPIQLPQMAFDSASSASTASSTATSTSTTTASATSSTSTTCTSSTCADDSSTESSSSSSTASPSPSCDPLHIVWNHRWERDKSPSTLLRAVRHLIQQKLPFHLSVIGQQYSDVPIEFAQLKEECGDHIVNWGNVDSRDRYWQILQSADIVLSTAVHENYGVSLLEGIACHCYPLAPDALVYPEYLPPQCLYSSESRLHRALRYHCRRPRKVRALVRRERVVPPQPFTWRRLRSTYGALLGPPGTPPPPSLRLPDPPLPLVGPLSGAEHVGCGVVLLRDLVHPQHQCRVLHTLITGQPWSGEHALHAVEAYNGVPTSWCEVARHRWAHDQPLHAHDDAASIVTRLSQRIQHLLWTGSGALFGSEGESGCTEDHHGRPLCRCRDAHPRWLRAMRLNTAEVLMYRSGGRGWHRDAHWIAGLSFGCDVLMGFRWKSHQSQPHQSQRELRVRIPSGSCVLFNGALHEHAVLQLFPETAPQWWKEHQSPFVRGVALLRDTRWNVKVLRRRDQRAALVSTAAQQSALRAKERPSYHCFKVFEGVVVGNDADDVDDVNGDVDERDC